MAAETPEQDFTRLKCPVVYMYSYPDYTSCWMATITRAQYHYIDLLAHGIEDSYMLMDLLNPEIKKSLVNWRDLSQKEFQSLTEELSHEVFLQCVEIVGEEVIDDVFLSSPYPSKLENDCPELTPVFVYLLNE